MASVSILQMESRQSYKIVAFFILMTYNQEKRRGLRDGLSNEALPNGL